ncbi:MAG: hypothetical protein OXC07_11955 [Kistimonas sp.]|nr:hypothetical protein [Kistimonas sp.]
MTFHQRTLKYGTLFVLQIRVRELENTLQKNFTNTASYRRYLAELKAGLADAQQQKKEAETQYRMHSQDHFVHPEQEALAVTQPLNALAREDRPLAELTRDIERLEADIRALQQKLDYSHQILRGKIATQVETMQELDESKSRHEVLKLQDLQAKEEEKRVAQERELAWEAQWEAKWEAERQAAMAKENKAANGTFGSLTQNLAEIFFGCCQADVPTQLPADVSQMNHRPPHFSAEARRLATRHRIGQEIIATALAAMAAEKLENKANATSGSLTQKLSGVFCECFQAAVPTQLPADVSQMNHPPILTQPTAASAHDKTGCQFSKKSQ